MDISNATLLDDMMVWAETQGVSLTVFERAEDTWEIDSIERAADSPKGTGKSVLLRLSQEADRRGCTLILSVMGGNSALEAWYADFGFVLDGPRDTETADLHMRRKPKNAMPTCNRRPRPG